MSNQTMQKENKLKYLISAIKERPKLLIAIIVVLISLFSIFIINDLRVEKKNIKFSESFNQANILISNNKNKDAKKILINIVEGKHKFYSILALNTIIENNLLKNTNEIEIYFNKVISIKQEDKEINHLARLKKGLFLLSVNETDEKLILNTFNPIINSDSIWRNTAINLMANYYTHLGEDIKSNEYLNLLNSKIKK